MRFLKMLLVVGILSLMVSPAWAQVSGSAPVAEPPHDENIAPPHHTNAGPFTKGSKRVNVVGGMGSTFGQSYLIIGAGISYYIADGLALGVGGEGWILQDPTIWKVSPEIRYTFWKLDRFKPYVGAFYRKTFIGDPFDDYNSWGGRAGVSYRSGNSYVSLGVVHEEFLDCDSSWGDCSSTYPEISFWFSF
jgi:hypothetical protein